MTRPAGTRSDGVSAPDDRGRRRSDRTRDDSWRAFLRELPVLLLIAFGLAFLLRTFVIQVFWIPSASMAPTLQEDDRIIVEKLTYRFRDPRRGEIVVFEEEELADAGPSSAGDEVIRRIGQFLGVVPANARDLVKRVVGLPGDRLVIEEGTLFVNGERVTEPYVVSGDPRSHGPFDVPEGTVFVLGDNRPNSSDSRFSLGPVDMDRVVGRAVLVIWPLDRFEGLGSAEQFDVPDPDAAPSAPRAPPAGWREAA